MYDQRVADLKNRLNLGIIEEVGNIPCANFPDAWFPEHNSSGQYQTYLVKQAVEGCLKCPLIKLCADYAIEADEEFGIWGGLTRSQRKRMRQARRRLESRVAS